MAFELRVTVDTSAFQAVLATLQQPTLGKVAARALTDTARNGQVQATKQVAPLLGVKSAVVKESFKVVPARPSTLHAALVATGRPIPLIEFRPKDTKRTGVNVRIARKTENYRHAFIATMKTGHKAVFERVGRERGPIRELFGPSVPGMYRRRDVLPVVLLLLRDRLTTNLQRQLDRQARLEAGKTKPRA
jgi:hypothetical protein